MSRITVGSIFSTNTRSSFSNFGTCLDVFAPGEFVISAYSSTGSDTDYKVLSGTSMSAPHVSGAVAIFMSQNDCATPERIGDWIKMNGISGVHNRGEGSPDLMLQVDCDNHNDRITCADLDPCSSSPCDNDGKCVDIGRGQCLCECAPGYTGENCEQEIDECASSPCVHGECVDEVNQFKCICEKGYTGRLCDTDKSKEPPIGDITDECVHNVCRRLPRLCLLCGWLGLEACRGLVSEFCIVQPRVCEDLCDGSCGSTTASRLRSHQHQIRTPPLLQGRIRG